jgi:clathrin heavy chain
MAQQLPIVFSELVNLTSPAIGISGDCIKIGACSMESDKFITVCENNGGTQQVAIIDLNAGNTVTRQRISAEAAIMNPVSRVIALRAGNQLQIFNLELKAKMKSHAMPVPVQYWTWTSPNSIALVTATSVFHWSIEGDAAPVKIFDRNAAMTEGTQIINYQVSQDGKWCLLIGISAGPAGPSGPTINGNMQLYSTEKKVSQMLQGHTGAFATIKVEGRSDPAQVLCFEQKKPDSAAQIFVMEVGRAKDAAGPAFRVTPQNIPVPADAGSDFPVSMCVSSKHDIIYMVSKMGYLYMFDVMSGKPLYRARITQSTVFAAVEQRSTGGILGITTRTGQVLQVSLNESNLVPYIINTLRDQDLALSLASRLGLSGADDIYTAKFNTLMSSNDIAGAAKLAANSPNGILRSVDTIRRFQQVQGQPGQPQPVFQYFSMLLENGKLNKLESYELAGPVLQQGRPQMLEKWISEDKLTHSEELGDLLVKTDISLALTVYLAANVPEKAIKCMLQKGDFDKIPAYASKVGYNCDYSYMLQNLVRSNPQGAVEFAKKLNTNASGQLLDTNSILEVFMSCNLLKESTSFLLEALKGDRLEEGFLQTKLLEINLMGGMANVADAILDQKMFSHYDKHRVGQLCEQAGLYTRALESYTDVSDVKRVIQNAAGMNPEFVLAFFGPLNTESSLDIIKELLGRNIRQNLQLVVQIATKYSSKLGEDALIKLFEDFKSFEGLYYYLGSIVNASTVPLVHFKYIEAAAKMQQFKEVERVCRDSTVFDPQEVKVFLMEAKLPDPRPLIHVCDRFDFVEEMTGYLYSNNLTKYIEVYVLKVSPQKTPMVFGKLLDLDCNEDFLRNLLQQVGQMAPAEELVEQAERRNRLRLLQPWLEARLAQGNQDAAVHNAIGKIYISLNREPVQFLQDNQFYDPKVLGAYCEKLDPHLAFVAYKRGHGECDDELVKVTLDNGLFKDLARYLVERQDLDLWGRVLKPEGFDEEAEESPSRRYLIDQIVQTALPETKNPDEVSVTVKAFMQNDLPGELIELLERIVLQGSDFSQNPNLQNLLILTALKADKEKVMEYINRLDNFDGPDIAKIACGEEYELFEEAFTIYVKFAKKASADKNEEEKLMHNVSAVEVIVDMIRDLDRGKEFAERVNEAKVWSKLGRAQLAAQCVSDAIASFLKAKDPANYLEVIDAAHVVDNYAELVPYLQMARKDIKESALDTELIYALARTHKLSQLEEFVSVPNVAKIDLTGERCFDEGLFEAAKILFRNINNNAKLALCFVNLEQYREAVDAATKANSIATWKDVNVACVRAEEFRLANICGLHIIVQPDHLLELINLYERVGRATELIQMMEQGLGLDNAHSGVFTELGVLYTKYLPEKLMEHIKIFWSRCNVVKLLKACEKALLWNETVYLYKEDGQHDAAVKTMTDHSCAFSQDLFLDCVSKVRNPEVQYKAITFYIKQHPLQLGRLLQLLTNNLDHSRVIHLLRKNDAINLAVDYMKSVQKEDLSVVNEALNEYYISEEDYESLRASFDDYKNFDQIYLAQKVEKHELLEFRRVAAYIYKKNGRFTQSVQLSKEDRMYKDAIDTTAESKDLDVAEDLLRFFVSVHDKACFAACLFTCYDLIKPDVAIELAWRNGYTDFVMPYIIQYTRHLHDKIKVLDERTAPKKEEEVNTETGGAGVLAGGFGNLMIGDGGYDNGYNGGYNDMGMGGGMNMNMNMGGGMDGGFPQMPQMNQGGFQQDGFQQGGFNGGY